MIKRETVKNGRPPKYKNTIVKNKHGVFDSKKEYLRFLELQQLADQGLIKNLRRQVRYKILPSGVGRFRNEKSANYTADFVYTITGETEDIVEDVKSEITRKKPDYVLRRKLMLYTHNISIKEV